MSTSSKLGLDLNSTLVVHVLEHCKQLLYGLDKIEEIEIDKDMKWYKAGCLSKQDA